MLLKKLISASVLCAASARALQLFWDPRPGAPVYNGNGIKSTLHHLSKRFRISATDDFAPPTYLEDHLQESIIPKDTAATGSASATERNIYAAKLTNGTFTVDPSPVEGNAVCVISHVVLNDTQELACITQADLISLYRVKFRKELSDRELSMRVVVLCPVAVLWTGIVVAIVRSYRRERLALATRNSKQFGYETMEKV